MNNKVIDKLQPSYHKSFSVYDKLFKNTSIKSKLVFYIYLLPLLIMVILFGIWPIIKSISTSFTDSYSALSNTPKYIGLNNYAAAFKDSYFIDSLIITLKFTLISVPINILLAFVFALALSSKILKYGRTFFKLAIFIPVITSDLVVCIVWRWMFNSDLGAINAILSALHLPLFAGLASTKTVLIALGIVTLWKNVGLYTIIFLTNLQLIDPALYEASDLDGANYFQRIRHITIPELRPSIMLNSVYAIIQYLKVFSVAKIMTQGGPNYASNFVAYYAYDKFAASQFGEATSMATILFILIIIIFAVTYWLNRMGIE